MKKLVLVLLSLAFIQLNIQSQDWEALNYSLGDVGFAVPHMGVSHDNMKIGTGFSFSYVGPMQLSTDGGENWTEGYDNRIKSIQFDNDGNIYILEELKNVIVYNGSLFKSTDNGATWEEILDVEDYVETVGFKVTGDGQVYVPTNAGLKYSPDGGATWSDISCPHVPYGVLKTSSGRLIITTYNSGVEYSDDNGATWNDAEGDLGNVTFGFLQEHPTTGNIYVCSFGGVLESTDGGESFYLKAPDPWIAINVKEFAISKAGNFYFYGLHGIYESSDAVEWTNIADGLPAGNGYDFQLTDDHVFVMVDSMIYKREIATSPSRIASKRYEEIDMLAWPNPSNGSVSLTFTLPERENVTIDVLNLNGMVIKSLNKGIVSKGNQTLNLDLQDLSNGIYLGRIMSETGIGVKRIEIMK